MQLLVRNRNSETRAEHPQFVFVKLLLLMGDVLAFASFAESVAFNCLGQNNGRRSGVLDRRLISSMNFDRIVSAQPHARQLLV